MNKRSIVGAAVAFVVIFNLGYVFHEILAVSFFKASFGPGVQRARYIIPVIAAAFAIYVALIAIAYPVVHGHFVERRDWPRWKAGALLGLYCGFLWDALQGGLIEYATYNVSIAAMFVDSAYHTADGVLAGTIIGSIYRPGRPRAAIRS
jgi:hypothetical protein